MSFTLEGLLKDQTALLELVGLDKNTQALDAVRRTAQVLQASAPLYRKMQALLKAETSADGLARFLKALHKHLSGMKPGDAVFVPCGWRAQVNGREVRVDIPLVVECEAAQQPTKEEIAAQEKVQQQQQQQPSETNPGLETTADASSAALSFRITVCASGPGLEYHPRIATLSPAKIKYVTAASIANVPAEDAQDTAFWMSLLSKYVSVLPTNTAQSFYEVLPLLKREPLDAR